MILYGWHARYDEEGGEDDDTRPAMMYDSGEPRTLREVEMQLDSVSRPCLIRVRLHSGMTGISWRDVFDKHQMLAQQPLPQVPQLDHVPYVFYHDLATFTPQVYGWDGQVVRETDRVLAQLQAEEQNARAAAAAAGDPEVRSALECCWCCQALAHCRRFVGSCRVMNHGA